jgi:hypothetical protein
MDKTKTSLPVSPKKADESGAFPVIRISSDGHVTVRAENEERVFRLAAVNDNDEIKFVLVRP